LKGDREPSFAIEVNGSLGKPFGFLLIFVRHRLSPFGSSGLRDFFTLRTYEKIIHERSILTVFDFWCAGSLEAATAFTAVNDAARPPAQVSNITLLTSFYMINIDESGQIRKKRCQVRNVVISNITYGGIQKVTWINRTIWAYDQLLSVSAATLRAKDFGPLPAIDATHEGINGGASLINVNLRHVFSPSVCVQAVTQLELDGFGRVALSESQKVSLPRVPVFFHDGHANLS
jgi:hypothetical protein